MKSPLVLIVCMLSTVVVSVRTATALPPWAVVHGNSCAVCHESSPDEGGIQGGGEQRLDAMSVLSLQGFDPDESLGTPPEDWQDRGELKMFTAQPGQTVDLTMHVENGATEYAIQLKRLAKEGFSGSGNTLAGHITPDPAWVAQGFDESTYYTNSLDEDDGHDWPVGSVSPIPYTFTLTLAADTPVDLYDLEFATAGIDPATTYGKWYGDEHFYLRVVPEPAANLLFAASLVITCIGVGRHRQRIRSPKTQ